MNTYILEQILAKHNESYNKFWNEILEPNQTEINKTTDYKERQILQATQNKIIAYVNEQSEVIEQLLKQLAKAPTVEQINYYKRYCKQARSYIENLGGNPSNVSYLIDKDLC